jgi:hypothetical protein
MGNEEGTGRTPLGRCRVCTGEDRERTGLCPIQANIQSKRCPRTWLDPAEEKDLRGSVRDRCLSRK